METQTADNFASLVSESHSTVQRLVDEGKERMIGKIMSVTPAAVTMKRHSISSSLSSSSSSSSASALSSLLPCHRLVAVHLSLVRFPRSKRKQVPVPLVLVLPRCLFVGMHLLRPTLADCCSLPPTLLMSEALAVTSLSSSARKGNNRDREAFPARLRVGDVVRVAPTLLVLSQRKGTPQQQQQQQQQQQEEQQQQQQQQQEDGDGPLFIVCHTMKRPTNTQAWSILNAAHSPFHSTTTTSTTTTSSAVSVNDLARQLDRQLSAVQGDFTRRAPRDSGSGNEEEENGGEDDDDNDDDDDEDDRCRQLVYVVELQSVDSAGSLSLRLVSNNIL